MQLKTNEITLSNNNIEGFSVLKVLLLINISLLLYTSYKKVIKITKINAIFKIQLT